MSRLSSDMFCPQCGASSDPSAQFCAACGAALAQPGAPVQRARPPLVTLLAVLAFLGACGWIVASLIFVAASGRSPEGAAFMVTAVSCFVAGALALACGYGLWTLRPFGRYLQIAFSIFGLLGFPLITLINILILVYMFNAGIRVLFSGRPVETLTPQEQAHLRSLRSSGGVAWVVGILIGLLVMVGMTGIMAAIAIPNLLTAIDRGKQKRTMADIRSISAAVEAYKAEFNNSYPSVTTVGDLQQAVQPRFIRALPTRDGWGREFLIESSPTGYTILSHGKDGIGENCELGTTVLFNEEICFVNGQFVRSPDGAQSSH